MHFLISNDDGYRAKGLVCLAQALASIAQESVVAPDRDRSGANNSLTLEYPLRAALGDNGYISVDGTPTDCVHLAITGLLETQPDMVVSGINSGANLGDDVIYSGIVAAAMEGRFLGYPAMAISLAAIEPRHFETASQVAVTLIKRLETQRLSPDIILNVNVPDVHFAEIAGFRGTRLGHRHKAEPVIRMCDPRGRAIYWVGPAGGEQDAGPGTDFYAVKHGYVSVTPIQVDPTRYESMDLVAEWLEGC
jgi:5'-nucleotidase